MRILALALCAAMTLSVAPAGAQVGKDARPPDAPGPALPAPQPGENLSDQMNRTDGVIPPTQNLDPGMAKPAPDVGTTPVLPPPDTKDMPQK